MLLQRRIEHIIDKEALTGSRQGFLFYIVDVADVHNDTQHLHQPIIPPKHH